MDKDFLLVKQKFIENLLNRYSFWFYLTPHQLQTWTNTGAKYEASFIAEMPQSINLPPLEHLIIMPLVFDYLDVTASLKLGLSDEPFRAKLKTLDEKLDNDLISRITVSIYENLSKVRNKLLHQKGSFSECGNKIIVIKDELSINLSSLRHINSLAALLSKNLKNKKQLSLYDKSLIFSSYKSAFPGIGQSIIDSAGSEGVVDVHVSTMRYTIDMRPKEITNFEDLKDHLLNHFLNEEGKLIGNTNFLFKYREIEYSMPGEYLYKNPSITTSNIGIWAIDKHITTGSSRSLCSLGRRSAAP